MIWRLVSKNQTAFISGRNILDGVLVMNEVMDLAKRERNSFFVVNVDYEKAYDSANWNYLRFLLTRMGFGVKWNQWMEVCIFSSFMSVIANGSANKDFFCRKGLEARGPFISFLVCVSHGGSGVRGVHKVLC